MVTLISFLGDYTLCHGLKGVIITTLITLE
jgi:hypothetical protein